MARILPFIRHQFFDSDGNPLVGGKIYTYVAGTTTPLTTYTDKDEGTENANPIILDANGEASIWVGDAFYKFVISDANDVVLRTIDKVTSASDVTAEATAAQVGAEAAQAAAEAARDAALTAETNAETAETNAASSASSAATQASNAATSASNASTSATNASNSASTASTQATNASNSASAASTSATNAATSASEAAASAATIMSGDYVTKTGAEAVTNKDYDGGTASNTSRLTLPKNTKTNLDGLTRKEGTLVYATDQAKAYVDNGSALVAVGSGSGGGGINYLSANSDAETDTTGYATYADAAGVVPVDGTGGSPNVTFTRTTSSPLRGTASFLFTKDAANRQGQGASYNFNLDSADGGKVMQLTFDYAIASGTYATGDLAVYVIHDPNGTPKVIQPSAYQIENVGVNSTARMTFQTEVSAQLDYTLCFHVASTSASAYTVKLDNVQLGPQVVPLGATVTDWTSFTVSSLSAISGTLTNYTVEAWKKQVGDVGSYRYKLTFNGAPGTWSQPIFPLPNGHVIDTAKIPGGLDFRQYSGGRIYDASGFNYQVAAFIYTTTSVLAQFSSTVTHSGTAPLEPSGITNLAPMTWASGDSLYFEIREIPIVGWSSSTVVSSSASTAPISAEYYGTTSTVTNAGDTVIVYNTKTIDSVGAYDTGTGRYNVKVPGQYRVSASFETAAITAGAVTSPYTINIKKNGTTEVLQNWPALITASVARIATISSIINANAGDYIEIVGSQQLVAGTQSLSNSNRTRMSINLIQGPSQIAASEVIAARYNTAVAQSIPGTGAATIVDFGTKDFDTHSGVTTGASWKYTAQAPGIYEVSSMVTLAGSTGWADTEGFEVTLYKNGVANHRLGYRDSFGSASSVLANAGGCGMISLVAGDYIDVRVANTSGGAINTFNSASYNWVTVKRLGGVM